MELEVYRKDGTMSGAKVTLSTSIFEIEPHEHSMYEAVKAFLANQRQGTHKTKTRGEVAGAGKKLWKQKKTGRARIGSVRSPLWKGGGTIFGPQPRDYSIELPVKVKRLARKSALSLKAKESNIRIVEDFSFDKAKTKNMTQLLKALNLDTKKILFLTPKTDESIYLSGRNIPRVRVEEAQKATTYEILKSDVLILQQSAVAAIEKSFGGVK
ncbi:MAG: 50S ribosomal protein L4 [Ignavibacteriales bacterium]|nr:50S ribosomal protein L4 [Ignavibacteriales bacterium]